MDTAGIIPGAIAAILTLALLFKPFFDNAEGFVECLRYSMTPDIFSWFNGEGVEDWWAEMKLSLWLICGGAAGYGAYAIIAAT
ncbi:MAG: hypothetical protein ACI8P0_004418 [Planctomycetaceae bacterium]|jgi:hypothetical protein